MAATAVGLWLVANPVFPDEPAQERVIDLKGTSNTRDIGGYKTSDGHTLRWRQLIRSENLSRLTEEDFRKLEELGIKTVVDLRTEREVEQSPTVWKGDNPPRFFHFPVGHAKNEWFTAQRNMLKKNRFTEEESLEHMKRGYRMIAEEGPPSYRQLMALVLDQSNWPILFHCSAGKDRAGVATALILEAVGVDRDTIMQDFLLTNEVSRAQLKSEAMAKARQGHGSGPGSGRGAGKAPTPAAWFPIIGVEPEMLETFYASVEEQYGSMADFLTEIGLDDNARRALAASLTTDGQFVVGE